MQRAVVGLMVLGAFGVLGCRTRVSYASSAPRSLSNGYSAATVPSPPIAGWFAARPPNTGFSIDLPGPPETVAETGYDEDGASFQSVSLRTSTPYGQFGAIVTQWEGGVVGDPLEASRRLADRIVEITESNDRRARRVSIPGFYAREDIGHTADGGFFALRQFVGRERLYVAVATVANDPTGLSAAEHFMQSIQLDRQDAMLPEGESTQPVPLYLPDVDFAADMPPLSARRSAEVELGDDTVDSVVFESRHPGGLYRVTVLQPRGRMPEDVLGLAAATLGFGTADAYVHASGFPGRSFRLTDDVRTQAYLTAQRVYVVQVTGVTSLGAAAVDAFFDSFRIL
ncbi:MAG: hypothetical protein KC619_25930 [Myxococcales bacterium]|nr:hypothetical protein [Myxococcales bacterium]